jgi:hypothetical protein
MQHVRVCRGQSHYWQHGPLSGNVVNFVNVSNKSYSHYITVSHVFQYVTCSFMAYCYARMVSC